jgi:hypothetical protein
MGHHHLVCRDCGRTIEVEAPESSSRTEPGWSRARCGTGRFGVLVAPVDFGTRNVLLNLSGCGVNELDSRPGRNSTTLITVGLLEVR